MSSSDQSAFCGNFKFLQHFSKQITCDLQLIAFIIHGFSAIMYYGTCIASFCCYLPVITKNNSGKNLLTFVFNKLY